MLQFHNDDEALDKIIKTLSADWEADEDDDEDDDGAARDPENERL